MTTTTTTTKGRRKTSSNSSDNSNNDKKMTLTIYDRHPPTLQGGHEAIFDVVVHPSPSFSSAAEWAGIGSRPRSPPEGYSILKAPRKNCH